MQRHKPLESLQLPPALLVPLVAAAGLHAPHYSILTNHHAAPGDAVVMGLLLLCCCCKAKGGDVKGAWKGRVDAG